MKPTQELVTIRRAKKLLMKEKGITEPTAYKMLRDEAMDNRIKIIDVADRLIESRKGEK